MPIKVSAFVFFLPDPPAAENLTSASSITTPSLQQDPAWRKD
jgi:hypothetical protein